MLFLYLSFSATISPLRNAEFKNDFIFYEKPTTKKNKGSIFNETLTVIQLLADNLKCD